MSQSTSHKNTPNHVAIIMDGNGRWASNHGKDRLHGHNSGVSSVREVLTSAQKHGVKYLTLYTFSTENWNFVSNCFLSSLSFKSYVAGNK